jgi:hypothetical protein
MNKDNKNNDISRAFGAQAAFCAAQDAPLMAALMTAAKADFDAGNVVNFLLSGWSGNPVDDALPLRLAGFLHFQALSGAAPELATFYASCGGRFEAGREAEIWELAQTQLHENENAVRQFLRSAPQTNETGRAAILLAGFSQIAQMTGLPLRLREIGSSAGLNLLFDFYDYKLGAMHWGSGQSALEIESDWQGTPPQLQAEIAIADRRGCDLFPVDLRQTPERLRLQSYIWGDMTQRRSRLLQALQVADAADAMGKLPEIDRADAARWVASQVMQRPSGQTTVLFHSITWQYLDVSQRMAIEAAMEQAGETATAQNPLAWLRMDVDRGHHIPVLEYDLWTGGAPVKRRLATCHAHGTIAVFGDA